MLLWLLLLLLSTSSAWLFGLKRLQYAGVFNMKKDKADVNRAYHWEHLLQTWCPNGQVTQETANHIKLLVTDAA